MYHDIPAARLYEGAKIIEPSRTFVPVDTLIGRTLYILAQFGETYQVSPTLAYLKGRNQERLDHLSLSS